MNVGVWRGNGKIAGNQIKDGDSKELTLLLSLVERISTLFLVIFLWFFGGRKLISICFMVKGNRVLQESHYP